MNRRQKLWAILLMLCMGITVLCSGMGLTDTFAQDGTITRVEWLHELTTIFEMTVEEDNYPDNYYSDINSNSEYYYDVMLATEFGLIDVEAGEQFKPDDPVTREFAAHTLNLCIGYVLEDETYTFSESASVTYADDIQVAINRGWLALSNGAFLPEQAITTAEQTVMLDAAKAAKAATVIDENYNSTWEYADGVVEIPKTAKVELTAPTQITITNSDVTVNEDDIFAFVLDGFPMAYKAESVSASGTTWVIEVSDVDQADAFVNIDVQGSVTADLSEVTSDEENVSVTYIVGGTEAKDYEDGTRYNSPEEVGNREVSAIEITKDYAIPESVSKEFELAEGVEATITCKVTNVGYDHYNLKKEAYSGVYGDLEFSCNVSMDVLEAIGVEKEIELIRIPIQGNFVYLSVDLEAELGGELTFNLVEHVAVGVRVEDGIGCSLVKNFYKKEFTIESTVEGKIGAKVSAVINAGAIKGTIYGKVGAHMNALAKNNGCVHFSSYLYAAIGAEVKVNVIFYKNSWGKELTLWNKYNSPVRVVFHYEDGVEVKRCTRDDTTSDTTSSGSSQFKYYSPINTRYGYNGASKGLDADGNEYTIFDYKLNDDNTAVITAYYGNVSTLNIPGKLDGYTVVGIDKDVFRARSELRIVVMPDSITSIGRNAFRGNTNLSSVTLSKNLEFLDYNAFALCNSLRSIKIPKSLTDANATHLFGDNNISFGGPFNECVNLKTVTFEEGTEFIADDLFYNCIGLEQIIIPDSVIEIGAEAFRTCENLKSVVLSDNVVVIGDNAFYECEAITEVELPDGLVEISEGAFRKTGLAEIIVPDSVIIIGKNAFRECGNLSNVKLSKNLVNLDYNAFARCNSLTSIVIPKSLIESQATHLYGDDIETGGPFNECANLKNIIFEEGITVIADGLLSNCYGLEEIVIPDTVTEIGERAFQYCPNLREIVVPDSVKTIGKNVFADCDMLASVTLGGRITEIPNYAFAQCPELTEIVIPYPVTKIGNNAFQNCTKLAKVTISRNVKSIGTNVFSYPKNMTIYGVSGTYAEEYATANNISFVGYEVAATNVSLEKTSLTLKRNSTEQLAYFVAPINATDAITWESSDTGIVTVAEDGTVKGVGDGTAVVTAYVGNVSASCTITVVRFVTTVDITETSVSIEGGKNHQLSVIVYPSNATNQTLEWSSSDDTVAMVDANGIVTALKMGTVTITATATDGSGQYDTCTVNVASNPVVEDPVEAFVERMYTVALNRNSDPAGKADWVAKLRAGTHDGAGLAFGFIMSPEFINRNLTDEEYVYTLYKTFFNRDPDEGGNAVWLAELAAGRSREFVLSRFVNLDEFTNLCNAFEIERGVMMENGTPVNPGIPQFVKRLYKEVMGRDAEAQGLYDWTMALVVRAHTPETAATQFFNEAEYLNKNTDDTTYVTQLYRVFLDRTPDGPGLADWVGRLSGGQTRNDIIPGFSNSNEFKEIAASYGLN